MHEYTVELRISGAELVPTTISETLGLEPSSLRQVGERRSEKRVWDEALWGYSGFPSGTLKTWSSLEEGLNFILDKLGPFCFQIDTYKQKYDVVWWCGHFQSSFNGGPVLSAKLLRKLADFGVDLYIDDHFVDVDPND